MYAAHSVEPVRDGGPVVGLARLARRRDPVVDVVHRQRLEPHSGAGQGRWSQSRGHAGTLSRGTGAAPRFSRASVISVRGTPARCVQVDVGRDPRRRGPGARRSRAPSDPCRPPRAAHSTSYQPGMPRTRPSSRLRCTSSSAARRIRSSANCVSCSTASSRHACGTTSTRATESSTADPPRASCLAGERGEEILRDLPRALLARPRPLRQSDAVDHVLHEHRRTERVTERSRQRRLPRRPAVPPTTTNITANHRRSRRRAGHSVSFRRELSAPGHR